MIALVAALAAVFLAGAAVAIVVLATVGTRREPDGWLSTQAPGLLAGLSRRILGLHVRRPLADLPARDVPPIEHGEPADATQSEGAAR
jgi:uncharacterized membrane protein